MDIAQRCRPRNIVQSSLNYHRKFNASQKDNDAIYDIGHDRGYMRTHYVEGQLHGNNVNDLHLYSKCHSSTGVFFKDFASKNQRSGLLKWNIG